MFAEELKDRIAANIAWTFNKILLQFSNLLIPTALDLHTGDINTKPSILKF